MDIYKLLDTFTSDQRKKVSIRTSRLNLAVLRSYLGYHDIDIVKAKFDKRVKVPKLLKTKEAPVDTADIRKILLACSNRRLRTYTLVLSSGGMRAVEALAMRLLDIDYRVNPTKIHIREEYAKNREARDIYISDEATQYLKKWIEWKYRNGRTKNLDDLVFGVGQSDNPRSLYIDMSHEFGKLLDLSGFAERKDNNPRRKITLHSLRRFVDSTITTQAGQDYAEWFLGHSENSYYTKKEHELREIYATKCMKYLTFLDYTILEATGNNVDAKLEQKDQQIQDLRKEKDDQIQKLKEEMISMYHNQEERIKELTETTMRNISIGFGGKLRGTETTIMSTNEEGIYLIRDKEGRKHLAKLVFNESDRKNMEELFKGNVKTVKINHRVEVRPFSANSKKELRKILHK